MARQTGEPVTLEVDGVDVRHRARHRPAELGAHVEGQVAGNPDPVDDEAVDVLHHDDHRVADRRLIEDREDHRNGNGRVGQRGEDPRFTSDVVGRREQPPPRRSSGDPPRARGVLEQVRQVRLSEADTQSPQISLDLDAPTAE